MEWWERFEEARKRKKLSRVAVAKMTGLSKESVQKYGHGQVDNPRGDAVERLANAVGMTEHELRFGTVSDDAGSRVEMERGSNTGIPEIDVRASAGHGALVDFEEQNGTWGFPADWVRSEFRAKQKDLRIITVEGDSMVSDPPAARDIDPGDKVIVNVNDKTPSPPGIFIVYDGFGLVAKRVQARPHSEPATIIISSNNPHYADYSRVVDEAHIIGRVVGRIQRL